MRIAYVLNIFPKLSETFIAGELAELRRRGMEICVLSLLPPQPGLQHELIILAGLDKITCYDQSRFSERIQEFKPDLIHAHFAREATQKARELSLESGVPFSFTAHGYDIHRKPPLDFYERAMSACVVITVSESNAAHIHKTFGVPRAHIRVIPCGVDTERFIPSRHKSEAQEAPLILCVARHVEVKNLSLLLEACSLLKAGGTNFRCVLIGDGPLHEQLLAQGERLGLARVVQLRGAAERQEVLNWWQEADIGVLTSQNEGMPVCLMEAAACGVPVVATRVGGIPELVDDGATGLLTPPGDAAAMARALGKLLSNEELRQELGRAARARAEMKFSVVRQVDELLTTWTRALDKMKYESRDAY